MPPPKVVDQGRQLFDMRGALIWAQRVDKEEKAYLREDEPVRHSHRGHRRRHREHSRRSSLDSQSSGYTSEARGYGSCSSSSCASLSTSTSAPALMYETSRMPSDLRAIQQFGIQDTCLMTMKDRHADEGNMVPKLRMVPIMEDAHWVPGGKILKHKPEFYLGEADDKTKKKSEPWRLPAAGWVKPHEIEGSKAAERHQAQQAAMAALDAEEEAMYGHRHGRSSRASRRSGASGSRHGTSTSRRSRSATVAEAAPMWFGMDGDGSQSMAGAGATGMSPKASMRNAPFGGSSPSLVAAAQAALPGRMATPCSLRSAH